MPEKKTGKKTILVDFDGVLNSYESGWCGVDNIPDEPVEGAIEFLTDLVKDERFRVCIYSSRSKMPRGIKAMRKWLQDHGMKNRYLNEIRFPVVKPSAFLTIDDRAFHFQGQFPTLEEIDNFKPWNRP